jgi:hypothetical protein
MGHVRAVRWRHQAGGLMRRQYSALERARGELEAAEQHVKDCQWSIAYWRKPIVAGTPYARARLRYWKACQAIVAAEIPSLRARVMELETIEAETPKRRPRIRNTNYFGLDQTRPVTRIPVRNLTGLSGTSETSESTTGEA